MSYKDREKRKAYLREWQKKNRAHVLQKRKEYYAVNRKRIADQNKIYRDTPKNRKIVAEYAVRNRRLQREEVMNHYGGKCACCGETEDKFLCIDHIHGLGNKHRREVGGTGSAVYAWIIKHNFPGDFQILCWNCNHAKSAYPDGCPHQYKHGIRWTDIEEGKE